MKKIIMFLIILLLFLLSSCDNHAQYSFDAKETEVALNSSYISPTKYIVNVSSKTFHKEDCYIVKNIKKENMREIYDREFLTDRNYIPCKRCNP